MSPRKTNLDLVNECDSFPYPTSSSSSKEYENLVSKFYKFKVRGHDAILGFMPTWVVEKMDWSPEDWIIDKGTRSVILSAPNLNGSFANQALRERENGTFEVLAGWRNELYAIYGRNKTLLMSMERSATPLFGVVTYGVHMTAYVKDSEGKMKIWVPRRAKTKQTYGGMLDNTVAGGISTGEDPFDSIVREAHEEASLPEDIVRKGAKACGTVTYFHIRDSRAGGETGLCQPECQYVYDLELPASIIPEPEDGEVEEFLFMEVDEIKEAMAAGQFKPNCAIVMLDFFIRHGILRHDNEKDYIEIVSRLHRLLEFPTP